MSNDVYVVTVEVEPDGIVLIEVFTNIDDALEFEKPDSLVSHFEKVLKWPQIADLLRGGEGTIGFYTRRLNHNINVEN